MTLNYDKALFTPVKTRPNFDALYHGKGFQPSLYASRHEDKKTKTKTKTNTQTKKEDEKEDEDEDKYDYIDLT